MFHFSHIPKFSSFLFIVSYEGKYYHRKATKLLKPLKIINLTFHLPKHENFKTIKSKKEVP